MEQNNNIAEKEPIQPMTLEQWNRNVDNLTGKQRRESNDLPFIWTVVVLLDNLRKVASAERQEEGTNGMAEKANGNSDITSQPDTITTKNEASNNPRSQPYVLGDCPGQNSQVGVFIKGKCAVIAQTEDSVDSPESKPYPVSGSEVAQKGDADYESGCPDFREVFDLYTAGKLQLNFLYLFWGKNLGTFFNETLFEILKYYRDFGERYFKKALLAMVATFELPADCLPDDVLEKDFQTLTELCKLLENKNNLVAENADQKN